MNNSQVTVVCFAIYQDYTLLLLLLVVYGSGYLCVSTLVCSLCGALFFLTPTLPLQLNTLAKSLLTTTPISTTHNPFHCYNTNKSQEQQKKIHYAAPQQKVLLLQKLLYNSTHPLSVQSRSPVLKDKLGIYVRFLFLISIFLLLLSCRVVRCRVEIGCLEHLRYGNGMFDLIGSDPDETICPYCCFEWKVVCY